MHISIIAAVSENGVIGRDGELPWRLSADLQRFKRLTMGHHIIMGRKTFESIGRPLPGRKMVVVTRQPDYACNAAHVVHSLKKAIEFARDAGDNEAFIIGGGEIYREALEAADRMYISQILAEIGGDTHFPNIDRSRWRLVEEKHHAADAKNEYDHRFGIYHRK